MAILSFTNLSSLELLKRFDAELYNPILKVSFVSLASSNFELKKLSDICIIRSGTTPVDRDDNLAQGPILFKTTDIRNNVLNIYDRFYHISDKINERMSITKLEPNDVLLNIVGATLDVIGRNAFVTEDFAGANITQAMVLLRLKNKINDFEPTFIFVYLNSKYAQDQIKRYARPTGQYNLNLFEVGQIKLPKLPYNFQQNIRSQVESAAKLQNISSSLYSQAQFLLEKELGLDKIQFEKNRIHSANFSETFLNNRCDADFFQVKYRQLENHLSTLKFEYLHKIVYLSKGIEVGSSIYISAGKLFIRVSNLSINGFTRTGSDKYLSTKTFENLKEYSPKLDDILLTKDGSVGICYNVTENIEGVISGGIVNLKLLDANIPNEYLALVINSKICQMQIERDCSGALILHWKPEQIRQLKIPILHKSIMNELASLVSKSKTAQKESEKLLASAIKQVEYLIEKEVSIN